MSLMKYQKNKMKISNIIYYMLFESCRLCFGKMNYPRDPKEEIELGQQAGVDQVLYTGMQVHMSPIIQFQRAIEDKQGLIRGLSQN